MPKDTPDKWKYVKQYIGDGVFVEFDGYQLWVTTHNGILQTNKIALEPRVYQSMRTYASNFWGDA